MDQQNPQQKEKEKDDKKPGLPTLRETAQKQPQFKIKGLKAGQSILERLKQFKKKDLAFILAGLGVLFMAPLAEHFLMSPDNGDGAFREGWNVKPGAGGLGSGGSPFEPGAGGVAPGDLAGGGSDVITPLNVRDPSALIMGPGATQQAPATTSNASSAPTKESSDWKDALSQSAAHAASAATRAATPLPPLPPMSGGGLRGLSAVSGGGGASYSLPAINAGNVPNRGGGGGSLGLAKATNGYAGAAGPRGLTNAGGGLEQLKARAGQAGNDFNRGGAGGGLASAAGTNMGKGDDFGGAGQGGSGLGADKAGGQSSSKDSKSEGESLAFLAAKENQEKAIELKWKLIDKKAMMWPDLKEKMVEELMMTPLKKFTEKFADGVGDFIGGKGSSLTCSIIKDGDTSIPFGANTFSVSKDKIAKAACAAGGDKDQAQWAPTGTPNVFQSCGSDHQRIACFSSGISANKNGDDQGPGAPGAVYQQGMSSDQSKNLCDGLQKNIGDVTSGGGAGQPTYADDSNAMRNFGPQLLTAAQSVISIQDAILKDSGDSSPFDPSADCAGAKAFDPDVQSQGASAGKSMTTRLANVKTDMTQVQSAMSQFVSDNRALSGSLLSASGQPVTDEVKSVPSDSPLAKDINGMAAYVKAKSDQSKQSAASQAATGVAQLLGNANTLLADGGLVGKDWAGLTNSDRKTNPLLKADDDVKALGALAGDAKTQLDSLAGTVHGVSRQLDDLKAGKNSNAAKLQEQAGRISNLIDAMNHKLADGGGLIQSQKDYGDQQTGMVAVAEKMLQPGGSLGGLHQAAANAIGVGGKGSSCDAGSCSLGGLSDFGQKVSQSADQQTDDQNFLAAIGQQAQASSGAGASPAAGAQPAQPGQDQPIPATAKAVSDHLAVTALEKKGSDDVGTLKKGGVPGVAQTGTGSGAGN